jgi:hypothetical protein
VIYIDGSGRTTVTRTFVLVGTFLLNAFALTLLVGVEFVINLVFKGPARGHGSGVFWR